MTVPVRLVGSYLSPYVRKVLAALHLKGVSYVIDPIVPFYGDDRFSAASPLRRIPVLIDGDVTLCDSTVICEYLDETHPTPPLMPAGAAARARARWIEEYADTRMGDVFIWRLFNQVAIRPAVWGEAPDPRILQETLEVAIPEVMAWLETQCPADGFLFGAAPCTADLAVATFFRNAAFARHTPDAARFPRTAGLVARTLALDAFTRLVPFEKTCLRTPPTEHRAALAAQGAPLTPDTWGTPTPQRGVMPI